MLLPDLIGYKMADYCYNITVYIYIRLVQFSFKIFFFFQMI